MKNLLLPLAAVLLCTLESFGPAWKNDAPSLLKTTWKITFKVEGERKWSYPITFEKDGYLQNGHPNDRTPDNDNWVQEGNKVTMYINEYYVTYKGTIVGDRMTGNAVNKKGLKWNWRAKRL